MIRMPRHTRKDMVCSTCCYSLIFFWYGAANCLKLPSPSLPTSGRKRSPSSKSYCDKYNFGRPCTSVRTTTALLVSEGRKYSEKRNDWQDSQNRLEFQEEEQEREIRSKIRPNREYYFDESDEYFEGDDEEEDDDLPLEQGGNYWYNPAGKPYLPPKYRLDDDKENYIEQPDDDELYDDYHDDYYDNYIDGKESPPSRKRTTRKTTSSSFRNTLGPQEPPKLLQDFYKQFFWYGLDDEEADLDHYDKKNRMFIGGTRGKFNALDILQPSKGKSRRRGVPSSTRRREKYGFNDEEEYLDSSTKKQGIFSTFFTPPNDALNRQVTSWLDDNDDDEVSDTYYRRNGRDRIQQQPTLDSDDYDDVDVDSSPSVKDSQQREIFARRYDQLFQVKKNQEATTPRTKESNMIYQKKEKNNIKDDYYYDDEIEYLDDTQKNDKQVKPTGQDESRLETFLNTTATEQEATALSRSMMMKQNTEIENLKKNSSDTWNQDEQSLAIGNYSWQDRADAQERIPPAGMEAWGPQGSLGIDARTQMEISIKQELQEAIQRKHQQKQTLGALIQHLKECRSTAHQERKRIQSSRGYLSAAQGAKLRARLRMLDMQVRDAAINVRKCQEEFHLATEEMEDQKLRYWAVKSEIEGDAFVALNEKGS